MRNCNWPLPAIPTLRWRHNERDSVSNHQPHHCLLNRLFRRRSKQTSKRCVTGLCVGNSPVPGEFPAQMASYAENISIWWLYDEPTPTTVVDMTFAVIIPMCLLNVTWYGKINTHDLLRSGPKTIISQETVELDPFPYIKVYVVEHVDEESKIFRFLIKETQTNNMFYRWYI